MVSRRKKLLPTRTVGMSLYPSTSTAVTDSNINPQGEKIPGTDWKAVTNVAFELNSKDELNVKVQFQERKKITGWLRWFAFKLVTNCSWTKNSHPESGMGKQTSPGVCHSEEWVKEAKEGPTPAPCTAEVAGLSASCKCCSEGVSAQRGRRWWGRGGRGQSVFPAATTGSLLLSFFFYIKVPLKMSFAESTHC